jgi:hypothetical protein
MFEMNNVNGEPDNKGTGGGSSAKPKAEQDPLMVARQIQEDELNYRRSHRWNIFSWASGLLLGGIGGLFTISKLPGTASQRLCGIRIVLSAAILVFSAYASIWLRYHYKREQCAKRNLDRIYGKLLVNLEPNLTRKISGDWLSCAESWFSKTLPKLKGIIKNTSFDEITVTILGLAALAAAWLI